MRALTFAKRNFKEMLRDPINLIFLFGFSVVLMILLSAIQANIPVALFEIQHLTPGITVFGLSFMTLFSATLIARDRETSLLQRLYTTPLKPSEYILGYMLAIIPIILIQNTLFFILAVCLGLSFSINIISNYTYTRSVMRRRCFFR